MTPEGCDIFRLAEPGDDLVEALEWLADELGASKTAPKLEPLTRPALPTGALTADNIATVVAATLPDNAILCDESISTGRRFFPFTKTAAPHDYIQLTGGAIGLGLPMAAGAALACPDRRVVSLQADGSAMYTIQALWTQARENLDVTTILFSNRSYAILHSELRAVGAGEPGHNARRMLDLDQPAVDFTRVASGMGVEACRVTTAEELARAVAASLSRRGPYLIECIMP